MAALVRSVSKEKECVVAEELEWAENLYRDGHVDSAESIYEKLNELVCDVPKIGIALAAIAMQRHDFPRAVLKMQEVIKRSPKSSFCRFNLGEALRACGRMPEAILEYQEALRLRPAFPEALHALSATYFSRNEFSEAVAVMNRCATLGPMKPRYILDLARYMLAAGQRPQWLEFCAKSIIVSENAPKLQSALLAHVDTADGTRQLTAQIKEWMRTNESCGRSLLTIADIFVKMNDHKMACEYVLQALEEEPGNVKARIQLGKLLEYNGRLSAAIANFELAVQYGPTNAETHLRLGGALLQRMQHEGAEKHFREACRLDPSAANQQNLLLSLSYSGSVSEAELFNEHRRWADIVLANGPLKSTVARTHRYVADQPLRVGYLSADFRDHPVASFIEPIFERHDRARIQPVAFCNTMRPDQVTKRLRKHVVEWNNVRLLDDKELATLIQRSRLDVLVDLGGHTADSRLPVFLSGAAPTQVTYLGYPNTTGLPNNVMHYRFTDAICDPPQNDALHTEELVRLKYCFLCYRPQATAPSASPSPFIKNGYITFGCFNYFGKITQVTLATWARILAACPKSRLFMKNNGLWDPENRLAVEQQFAVAGVSKDRLTLLSGRSTTAEHLACYADMDIALDTFPYNGTTTTCEALWMGVPVVSFSGEAHRSRVGASLLTAVGLDELVAADRDGYVDVAVGLGSDPGRFKNLRGLLRERMRQSHLCQELAFSRRFDETLMHLASCRE